MRLTRNSVLKTARFAGMVQRYHTWPTIKQQSVGEHSWQMMRIWYAIWGKMPPDVSSYILWHDAGELVTGDPPFPFKSKNTELKALFDIQENAAVRDMGGEVTPLSSYQLVLVKVCDILEMWEFGLVELKMGNVLAQPIIEDTRNAVESKYDTILKPDDTLLIQKYMKSVYANHSLY